MLLIYHNLYTKGADLLKYIYQLSIILLISALGELLRYIIPLPIPASIYGLVLMFIALAAGIIKLEKIEKVSDFLLEIMPIAFIPGGVGLITAWDSLQNMLIPAIIITIVTTVLVIGITGRITQILVKIKRSSNNE